MKTKKDKKDTIILVLIIYIIALTFVFAVLPTIIDSVFGFNKPYCLQTYRVGDSVLWMDVLCEDLQEPIIIDITQNSGVLTRK